MTDQDFILRIQAKNNDESAISFNKRNTIVSKILYKKIRENPKEGSYTIKIDGYASIQEISPKCFKILSKIFQLHKYEIPFDEVDFFQEINNKLEIITLTKKLNQVIKEQQAQLHELENESQITSLFDFSWNFIQSFDNILINGQERNEESLVLNVNNFLNEQENIYKSLNASNNESDDTNMNLCISSLLEKYSYSKLNQYHIINKIIHSLSCVTLNSLQTHIFPLLKYLKNHILYHQSLENLQSDEKLIYSIFRHEFNINQPHNIDFLNTKFSLSSSDLPCKFDYHSIFEKKNMNCLELAAFFGYDELFKSICLQLTSNGKNLHKVFEQCKNLAKYAFAGNNANIIHQLKENQVKFRNCLEVAVAYYNFELSEYLLDQHYQDNEINSSVIKTCIQTRNYFCFHNIFIDKLTCLHDSLKVAYHEKDILLIEALIKIRLSYPNDPIDHFGNKILHLAVEEEQYEIVKILLESDFVNPNVRRDLVLICFL
ncbi:hypothetical protein TRFO_08624 [Tritrichomonas foetus]|uniref:DUF3447 domain-containing protein n=1 Tax=Tritrichomonas foetus TaxID=1144522 RepID=A0A1J4JIN9_9EUKA|nr:hypothetical protein TRFO_08624 [Tritrichomonas foetus]|eukprot:OHS99056.1 hypothetical protein TRFO_08624 [Tritrichomonas foetus]